MTLQELLHWGQKVLKEAGIEDGDMDAWLCMERIFDISRTCYYIRQNDIIDEAKKTEFEEMIALRKEHIPVQQILGEAWFAGFSFFVNDNVLIPRQDTELLVEEARKRLPKGPAEVLDLCTGSGCVLLALMKWCENISGTGVDLSADALAVARENGQRLGVLPKWIKSDLFQEVEGTFDLITSNPPYIASDVIPTLMPEVKDHEPLMALDGMEDGLYFYRRITKEAGAYLREGGWLCMEIGYDQGEALRDLLAEAGYEKIEIRKDLAGLDRVAAGRKPQEEKHV